MNMYPQPMTAQVGLTPRILEERKDFLGLTREDIAELKRLHGTVEAMAPAVVADFYTELGRMDEFRALVTDADTLDRMYETLNSYLKTLFAGHYDMTYARDRLRLGTIHHRIGVGESLVIASLYRLMTLVEDRLRATGLIEHPPAAIQKIFIFDLQLVIDAYVQGHAKLAETAKWETERHYRDESIVPRRIRANLFGAAPVQLPGGSDRGDKSG